MNYFDLIVYFSVYYRKWDVSRAGQPGDPHCYGNIPNS